GGVFGPALHRLAMHALLIGSERRIADATAGHGQLFRVAHAAGGRNVDVRDFRLGIAARQNFVYVAVAVLALGNVGITRGTGLGVNSMIVSRLLVGVTGGADRLGRRR